MVGGCWCICLHVYIRTCTYQFSVHSPGELMLLQSTNILLCKQTHQPPQMPHCTPFYHLSNIYTGGKQYYSTSKTKPVIHHNFISETVK